MDTQQWASELFGNALLNGAIAIAIFALLLLFFRGYRLFGLMFIPNSGVGTVTKTFALKHLANGRIIATRGEAGYQAGTLSPGIHFRLWPWQYAISLRKLVSIQAGNVGVVTAIDGVPIPPGRILGQHVECNLFQDAAAFIDNGGQRGPQADVLPPGEYRINRLLFDVEEHPALDVPSDKVALVITKDGEPLATGEIAGPEIAGHSSFQNADAFIANGGTRGQQEQVLMPGRYYINPLFVETEMADLTDVPIGHVGVAISYVGAEGEDQAGDAFTHGNIVKKGQRGVWGTPLDPGRCPINPRVMRIEIVPTTNTVLNWITGYKEAHGLDAGLESIDVRSKDGFSFPIEVSQIIHIAAKNAPKVIARFGTVPNLVSQVLEPMIDNYFRNAAQSSEFLEFLTERSSRQDEASKYIRNALGKLDVEAVDTLMGDIRPPQSLMDTLTSRKIAQEQLATFKMQQLSQQERQKFEQAKSEADTRALVVQASREAEIAKLEAQATVSRAEGAAQAKKINSEADGNVLTVIGAANASQTRAVGGAEADVLQLKVNAVGQINYSVTEMIRRLAENRTPIVPQIQMGAGGSPNESLAGALIGTLVAQMVAQPAHVAGLSAVEQALIQSPNAAPNDGDVGLSR